MYTLHVSRLGLVVATSGEGNSLDRFAFLSEISPGCPNMKETLSLLSHLLIIQYQFLMFDAYKITYALIQL